jgi:hypothetical protein
VGGYQGDETLKDQGRSIKEPDEPRMPSGSRSGWRVWVLVVGVFLVPGALYTAILAVPFLPLTTVQKLWLSSGLVVAAEVTFLLSALVLGREAVHRYRRFLNPRYWFGKKPT